MQRTAAPLVRGRARSVAVCTRGSIARWLLFRPTEFSHGPSLATGWQAIRAHQKQTARRSEPLAFTKRNPDRIIAVLHKCRSPFRGSLTAQN